MARDKLRVPSIQVGGNKPGEAFGGVIFSSDTQIGFNGEPTMFNVNVALDTQISSNNTSQRNFDISKNDLNLASPIDIGFGGAYIFRNMFLKSFDKSTTVNSKVLNLHYADGSILLDRIFVGLIHEHFHIGGYTQINEEGNGLQRDKFVVPHLLEMTIKCPKPEKHAIKQGKTTVTYTVCSATDYTLSKRKVFRYLANATGDPNKPYLAIRQDAANVWSGGYMVLGREEFTSAKCDLADVSYSFKELLNCIKEFGINVDLARYPERKYNDHFRKNYSGSLKDVLQNWGSDLGISFYWDFTAQEPTLVVVDMTDKSIQSKFEVAIAEMDLLDRGHGADMLGATDLIIDEKSVSNSLEGTFSQSFSSTMNRGPGAKDKNKKATTEVFFTNQGLEILTNKRTDHPSSGLLLNRDLTPFKTSMALGKYAQDVREVFNIRMAMQQHTIAGWKRSSGYFNACGFTDVIGLTFGPESKAFEDTGIAAKLWADQGVHIDVAEGMEAANLQDGELPNFSTGQPMYDCFIGVYDDNVKNYILSFEQAIADGFYGRHYVLSAPASENFICNKLFKMLETVVTRPPSKYYAANQHYKTPMAKFIERIDDLKIDALTESGVIYKNHLLDENNRLKRELADLCNDDIFKKNRQYGFFHFEREAPWSASTEDIKNLLTPYKLQRLNAHTWGEGSGHWSSSAHPRQRVDLVGDFLPRMSDMAQLAALNLDVGHSRAPTATQKSVQKALNMMQVHAQSGKQVKMVMVRRDPGHRMPNDFGHIHIDTGTAPNIIEEINALSSKCTRNNDVAPDDIEDCQTVCEGDLMEELCSTDIFGQPSLSCGEAEALKDSAYTTEIMHDEGGNILGSQVKLFRRNPTISVEDGGKERLFSDVEKGVVNYSEATITMPSENDHNGVLIYDRNLTVTDFGVRKVFDGLDSVQSNISPQICTVKYKVQDITQDATTVFNDENRPIMIKGEIPIDIIADMEGLVTEDGDRGYLSLQSILAERYHDKLKNNIADVQVDTPRETVSYKIHIDGAGSSSMLELAALLKQENGLESLSLTTDEGGFYLNVTFSNRPPEVPVLEAIYRKVGPISKSVQPKMSFYRSMT